MSMQIVTTDESFFKSEDDTSRPYRYFLHTDYRQFSRNTFSSIDVFVGSIDSNGVSLEMVKCKIDEIQ